MMKYSIHAITSTGFNYNTEVSLVMNDRIPQEIYACPGPPFPNMV